MTRLSHLILLFSAVAMTAALPHPGCAADCAESYISRDSPGQHVARDSSAGTADSFVNNVGRQAGPVADKGASPQLNFIPLGQVIGNILAAIFGTGFTPAGRANGAVKVGASTDKIAGQARAGAGNVADGAGAGGFP